MKAWRHSGCLTLVASLLSLAAPRTQAPTGAIAGHVVDRDGIAMPGAIVYVLANPTTQLLTAATSPSGEFRFPWLRDGSYSVAIRMAGFAWSVVHDVSVTGAQPIDLGPIALRVDASPFRADPTWPIHVVTSEGPFDIAVQSPDGCNGSVCLGGPALTIGLDFAARVVLGVFDGGSILPAVGDPAVAMIVAVPKGGSVRGPGAVYVIGDLVATDSAGRQSIGHVQHADPRSDVLAVIRKLPRVGPEFVRPVGIVSARLGKD